MEGLQTKVNSLTTQLSSRITRETCESEKDEEKKQGIPSVAWAALGALGLFLAQKYQDKARQPKSPADEAPKF